MLHHVSITFHRGYAGPSIDGIVNDLLAISGEPNVTIMEFKVLSRTIIPEQMPAGIAGHELVEKTFPRPV